MSVVVAIALAAAVPAAAQTRKPRPKPQPKPAPTAKAPAPEVPKPPPAPPSVSVTTKYTATGETAVTTVHSSGVRQRFEFGTGGTLIVQCDAKKAIQVSDVTKRYVVGDLVDATVPPAAGDTKGGPVVFRTTITDTGERREMFGLQARRIKTVTTREPSPSACDKSRTRSESDGWYADVPVAMQCGHEQPAVRASDKPDCADQAVLERTGPASALGYPLGYTTTIAAEGGKVLSTVSMEATALTIQPVDATKYEVPAGYAEVKDARELARAELAAKGEQPKVAGITRIGVVMPRNSSGAQVEPAAIGNELLDALAVHPYEPVALEAVDPPAVETEARQRECDFILFTELGTAKTTTPGRIGGLMSKVSRSEAKENHEAKVQYRLLAPGAPKPVVEKTTTVKSGAGLNVRTMLNVARLAARLYFGVSGGVMRAVLSNAGGGAGAADPMTNALNLIMTFGAPKQPPANSLEGTIVTALQSQAADVMKAIGRQPE